LLVIQNRVYKRLLSPFIKPDPIKSYSFTWQHIRSGWIGVTPQHEMWRPLLCRTGVG
jgi:hypothetical protein